MLLGRIKCSLYMVGAISFFVWIIHVQICLIFTTSSSSITTATIATTASRCRSYLLYKHCTRNLPCMYELTSQSVFVMCILLPSPSVFGWGKWGRKSLGKLLRVTQLLSGRARIQLQVVWLQILMPLFRVLVSLIVIFQNKFKQELFMSC